MSPGFFFTISPFIVIHVSGKSMSPALESSEKVLVQKKWIFSKLSVGDIVVFRKNHSNKFFVKRIAKIKRNEFFVLGDNKQASTDSRIFGYIHKKNIIGKVIKKL